MILGSKSNFTTSAWPVAPVQTSSYPITLALYFFFKFKFPPMWSKWWCVFNIYFKLAWLLSTEAITGSSSLGSTTHAFFLLSIIK